MFFAECEKASFTPAQKRDSILFMSILVTKFLERKDGRFCTELWQHSLNFDLLVPLFNITYVFQLTSILLFTAIQPHSNGGWPSYHQR